MAGQKLDQILSKFFSRPWVGEFTVQKESYSFIRLEKLVLLVTVNKKKSILPHYSDQIPGPVSIEFVFLVLVLSSVALPIFYLRILLHTKVEIYFNQNLERQKKNQFLFFERAIVRRGKIVTVPRKFRAKVLFDNLSTAFNFYHRKTFTI